MVDLIINQPELLSIITENLDPSSLKNLADTQQTNREELKKICKNQLDFLKDSFEIYKTNMVAQKFKVMYPCFPEKFLMSLPSIKLDSFRVTSYLECIPRDQLSEDVMCGIDPVKRPFIVTKTKNLVLLVIGVLWRIT